VESELRPYGRLRACISLANTHPTRAASTEGSVARRRALTKRQSAKGTPALAYEHHQAWSERLCTGTLTTPPLLCPHRLALPPRPWRSPVRRAHAPVCLQHPRAALLARLHCCRQLWCWSSARLCCQRGNTSVREMYLNIDAASCASRGTVRCTSCSCSCRPGPLYRAVVMLCLLRLAVAGPAETFGCCRATAPLCFHLKGCTAANRPKRGCESSCTMAIELALCCAAPVLQPTSASLARCQASQSPRIGIRQTDGAPRFLRPGRVWRSPAALNGRRWEPAVQNHRCLSTSCAGLSASGRTARHAAHWHVRATQRSTAT
jgi:hypothetical protein